jgi:hypothetical protein
MDDVQEKEFGAQDISCTALRVRNTFLNGGIVTLLYARCPPCMRMWIMRPKIATEFSVCAVELREALMAAFGGRSSEA